MPFLGKSGTSRINFLRRFTSAADMDEAETGDIWDAPLIESSKLRVASFQALLRGASSLEPGNLAVLTTLLQCEMNLLLGPAVRLRLPPRPPVQLADLRADASVIRPVDREFPERALRRCRRDCYEPSRRWRACGLHVRQTSGSRRPARVRGQCSAWPRSAFPRKSSFLSLRPFPT